MKFTSTFTPAAAVLSPRRTRSVFSGWLALAFATLLTACGGGGDGVTPVTASTLRPLSAEFSARKAVAYSPYRTATSVGGLASEAITEANVKQDLDLLVKAGFGLIRVFDSSDKVARLTLQVIYKYAIDIKVQLGVYVQSGDENGNQAEIARAVALAKQYRDIVLAVSVGNENMVTWSFNAVPPATMAGYITKVRGQITQPVTSDDNWLFWSTAPNTVTDVIDFVSLHTYTELDTQYPDIAWNWQQLATPTATRAAAMMDAALVEAKRQYTAARSHLDGRGLTAMPITIGETGWNAVDLGKLRFRAHPVNQKMYLDRLAAWAAEGRAGNGPKAVIYFEAFDETWKQADDKWGLFNANREARYAIQSLGTCGTTWACEAGTYQASDAIYYALAVANPAITASRYTLYSEAAPGPSEVAAAGLRWDAFDGTTAAYPEVSTDAAPGDGSNSIEVTPNPASYGWGLLRQSPTAVTDNLSGYAATGTLNFSIKTTYVGKIEIGLISDTVNRDGAEAFLQIANGQYGYCNNGTWCKVSIPLKDFLTANPKLDLSLITARFVIADRYANTGNFARSGQPKLNLDAIYWAK
jgi:exo-beta-1,3-glucanase (GH17 family)